MYTFSTTKAQTRLRAAAGPDCLAAHSTPPVQESLSCCSVQACLLCFALEGVRAPPEMAAQSSMTSLHQDLVAADASDTIRRVDTSSEREGFHCEIHTQLCLTVVIAGARLVERAHATAPMTTSQVAGLGNADLGARRRKRRPGTQEDLPRTAVPLGAWVR